MDNLAKQCLVNSEEYGIPFTYWRDTIICALVGVILMMLTSLHNSITLGNEDCVIEPEIKWTA